MRLHRFEIALIVLFFVFSWWLMNKSFGYDSKQHMFRVARHQVGDFGLHLSLIRSFSWGNNFPVESPFYPLKPLPYHYALDLVVGILERMGMRIDLSLNILSTLCFTALLFFIYKLPQVIFGKNHLLGVLSVILFVFHSSFTFIDFITKNYSSLFSMIRALWYLPDYIHKGPFDNSIISIFFTLNVYLNQRHLVAALAISFGLLYTLLLKFSKKQNISMRMLILIGLILGFMSRIHSLTFVSSLSTIVFLCVLFRKFKYSVPILTISLFIFSFHLKDIMAQPLTHPIIAPGFLAQKPLSFVSFFEFWILNLGITFFLIPFGFFLAKGRERLLFLSVIPLFIIGNIFQFSFRIDHNHSLFNFFFIIANFYVALLLVQLWKKRLIGKVAAVIFFVFLTASGIVDFMAVKNDFQYRFSDAPANTFMQWVRNNTERNAIFISKQEILDPVTLAGRKNYLGHSYYLAVMGYDSSKRQRIVRQAFEATSAAAFDQARKEGVKYLAVPPKHVVDFDYQVNYSSLQNLLKEVYHDQDIRVFEL